jgi:D-apionolactonase
MGLTVQIAPPILPMPSSPDRRVIHLATQEFSCLFETDTGFLRQIKRDRTEIVRAIYAAVRDENWNTIEPHLEIRSIRAEPDGFRVDFEARCEAPGVRFGWAGSIEGKGPSLSFSFRGEARTTFRKNRIGLCLLHPIRECAGLRCSVQNTTGSWINAEFPRHVSPDQPCKDLKAMRWSPSAEIEAELQFSGDIFETEDQRNWTDASFKTYCTPLAAPFPVLIEAGTKIDQQVTLNLRSRASIRPIEKQIPEIRLDQVEVEIAVPSLGLEMASHGQRLSETHLERLEKLGLSHLRADLRLSQDAWLSGYRLAAEEAGAIGSRLQPALFVTDNARREISRFREAIDLAMIDSCLIFHEKEISTSERWLALSAELLNGLQIVAGTNAYFAELNRNRPPRGFPAVYSINPQVHAFDDRSLMENLEAQPATIESARQFCSNGIFLSPITLRPRFNPNATEETIEPQGQLPASVDQRQRTMVGACWTAGSLAALVPRDGLVSLTYFETTGWRGLMESERGSPLPAKFGSSANEIFPLYHVFEFIAGATSALRLRSAPPDGLSALALRDRNGSKRYLLANLEADPKRVRCRLPADTAELRILDHTNVDALRRGTLPRAEHHSLVEGALDFDFPGTSLALVQLNRES